MKKSIIALFVLASVVSTCMISCVSGGSYSGSRSINHYHHRMGGWGSGYYGGDVIIIDDVDVGIPDVPIAVPYDDY